MQQSAPGEQQGPCAVRGCTQAMRYNLTKWSRYFVKLFGNSIKWRRDLIETSGNLIKWRRDFVKTSGNSIKWRRDLIETSGNLIKWRRDLIETSGNSIKWRRDFVKTSGSSIRARGILVNSQLRRVTAPPRQWSVRTPNGRAWGTQPRSLPQPRVASARASPRRPGVRERACSGHTASHQCLARGWHW